MKTVLSISELNQSLAEARLQHKRVGLVPTMGNLHEGHLKLIDQARESSDVVVASIFVNPLQFGLNEDLDNYPRSLKEDQEKLRSRNCDILFAPTDEEVYPHGREAQTQVEVPDISDIYCGASRPGHFRGVATVVCKLFGMVQPNIAIFGEKDFQQLLVIQRMTEDLSLPVEIKGAPIARNEQGLALSSRNSYLSDEQLQIAPRLNATLNAAVQAIKQSKKTYREIEQQSKITLNNLGFKSDYFVICRRSDLQPATETESQLVILAAAYLGKARLIDNIQLDCHN